MLSLVVLDVISDLQPGENDEPVSFHPENGPAAYATDAPHR